MRLLLKRLISKWSECWSKIKIAKCRKDDKTLHVNISSIKVNAVDYVISKATGVLRRNRIKNERTHNYKQQHRYIQRTPWFLICMLFHVSTCTMCLYE